MPPLLSNHWLMVLILLFSWHQIGQTINASSSPPTLLNDTKLSNLTTINKPKDFTLDNKLKSNLDHKLTTFTSENKSSNLFLSTSSLSTQLTSSSIDNLNDKKLINSSLSNESNGSKKKSLSEFNLNNYNQRVHFDNIHGGFSLINSSFLNLSSFATNKVNTLKFSLILNYFRYYI